MSGLVACSRGAVPWDLTAVSGSSRVFPGGNRVQRLKGKRVVLETHLTDVNEERSSWGRTACEHKVGDAQPLLWSWKPEVHNPCHPTHPGSGEDLPSF